LFGVLEEAAIISAYERHGSIRIPANNAKILERG
jgi:hypothetical protein